MLLFNNIDSFKAVKLWSYLILFVGVLLLYNRGNPTVVNAKETDGEAIMEVFLILLQ